MAKTPEPVGWFVKDGQLITILPEEDQNADEAITEEAKDHGIEKGKVKKGKPPEDWKDQWEGKKEETKKVEKEKEADNPGEKKESNPEPEVKAEAEIPKPEPPKAPKEEEAPPKPPVTPEETANKNLKPPSAPASSPWVKNAQNILTGLNNKT